MAHNQEKFFEEFKECPINFNWIIDEYNLRTQRSFESSSFGNYVTPGVKYGFRTYYNQVDRSVAFYLHINNTGESKIQVDCKVKLHGETNTIYRNMVSEKKTNESYILLKFLNDSLFNQRYFNNGKMTMEIRGTLKAEKLNKNKKPSELICLADILWKCEEDKNFVVVVGDKKIKVHKWILEARSPVLKAMMESQFREAKENRMEIKDFSFEIVKIAIECIYEQNIESQVNVSNASLLLQFGDKYDIQYFHLIIQNILIQMLNKKNVSEFANASVTYNAPKLRETCTCFIVSILNKNEKVDGGDTLCDEILKDIGKKMLSITARKVY